jgi:prophage maintenance system killer protein
MQIDFLTLNNVMDLHQRQINIHGGRDGIRDEGLLLSALAMPTLHFLANTLTTTFMKWRLLIFSISS